MGSRERWIPGEVWPEASEDEAGHSHNQCQNYDVGGIENQEGEKEEESQYQSNGTPFRGNNPWLGLRFGEVYQDDREHTHQSSEHQGLQCNNKTERMIWEKVDDREKETEDKSTNEPTGNE